MSVYEKEYKILSCDVDMFRRLRLSRLFTFTQEAAIAHTEQLGAGREKTLDRGFLWVVTMQHAQIKRLPEYDEKVRLISWPGETMHVMFPRYYSLLDEKDEEIVCASALWMLMDVGTRKMVFPDDEGIAIKGDATRIGYPLPRPVKPEETDKSFLYKVPFGSTDINGHLTNTKYFELAENLTDLSCSGKVPVYVCAEYSGEARFGEELNIGYSQKENEVYLSGTKEEKKKVFKLKMTY